MRSFGLVPGSAPVFLAISGGLDSVVLAHLLNVSGYQPVFLHLNFQLRGEESERDQQFVESLAIQWGLSWQTKKVDAASFAEQHKCSIQEAARRLRYDWFSELVGSAGKQAVLLTAHHADDNVETLLMHLFRGTGLRGLTGIPPINQYIRRPLLTVPRSAIEQYAQAHKIDFVEDSSNRSTDYTRNQLRLELMPLLRKIYPHADQNLLQNIERFRSSYAVYSSAAQRWIRKYVQVDQAEQRVSVVLLMQPENRAMIHEWLSPYGFTEKQESELVRLKDSQSGHWIESADGSYRVVKHRKHFILTAIPSVGAGEQWIPENQSTLEFASGKLMLKRLTDPPNALADGSNIAWLDADALVFPLLLRPWRMGDYFYPLGLNKMKKLARFLIDRKLSKVDKEQVWVIESGGRIVWVIGHRIDHRFRVQAQTRSVWRLELSRQ